MQVINNSKSDKIIPVLSPIKPFKELSEKLIPLVFMLAMYGVLQVLASFYQPQNNYPMHQAHLYNEEIPFSILVRNRRIDLGFSREVLSQKIKLSTKNIKAIEQGDATPTKEVEYHLRKVLGLALPAKMLEGEYVDIT